ncbi:DNA polymerase delta subunit 3-like [Mercenaria mercenaria]|uniref:DNA polymerase delta subunit 3-like n=1 Tax=Mercenaria mercenaria TaxID=6596 RepID=UPI00234F6DB9|nr:DNA polymerase delta subunit 3-like [Mercenaria mercenaria]
MTVEDLYMDNIDEYIKDENKIVTYKWLSQTLQVHCNTAKQMLYKYIDTERNEKGADGLNVTYFVSGLTKPDASGEQMFKCTVVPEEKLEVCKTTLAILTSCHVYSVQKSKLKDSNALYMTDFAKFKENVFDSNKFSSIQCERAELRSEDDMNLLSVNYTSSEPEKKTTVANGSTSSKAAGKKQPQSAIASMFAKSDAGKKGSKTDDKPQVKEEPKTTAKTGGKAGNKKADGMMAFFSKQTDKKASAVKETEKKVTTSKSPEKKKSPVKTETKSKKTAREEDSDEEIGRPKRRRTRQDLFDSDSEEEMEEEPESPIPPTPPPREITPEPEIKADSPEVEEIENPVPEKISKSEESTKGDNSGKRKRIKKRKQVNKTYMDKDGFMVTEKVYKEESTDASEAEEPVKKEVKKTTPSKSPPKGKKSPKKTSPGKKGQASGKQTSLMSFFKKS